MNVFLLILILTCYFHKKPICISISLSLFEYEEIKSNVQYKLEIYLDLC